MNSKGVGMWLTSVISSSLPAFHGLLTVTPKSFVLSSLTPCQRVFQMFHRIQSENSDFLTLRKITVLFYQTKGAKSDRLKFTCDFFGQALCSFSPVCCKMITLVLRFFSRPHH